jgi:cytochrome o ubiquinol oxidase operon protein cyoD
MTHASYELALGDHAALVSKSEAKWSGVFIYTTGLILAVGLTATSFWAANTPELWGPGVSMGLVVLAIAQMGVHLVFFLHITTGPDNTNNVLALAFGILIVTAIVTGSIWIMSDLGQMMPGGSMSMHMQH